MNWLKVVIIIETIIIVILTLLLIKSVYFPNGIDYCARHYQDPKCLLSPRVYTGIIQPNSYLILNFKPLKDELQAYIDENKFNLSVYVVNARDGASFGINEHEPFPAISLNKIPLSVIILRKVERGEMNLNTKIAIPKDKIGSSFGTFYSENVTTLSVKELLRYMLQKSDDSDFWTSLLLFAKEDLVDLDNYVNYYFSDVGSQGSSIYKTNSDTKSISNIFLSLYLSTTLKPENSELILSYLTNTSFDIKKYANLSESTVVSQKYGEDYNNITNVSLFHSCGIIYIEDSRFVYCIMSEDIEREKAPEVIGTIVNKIEKFIIEQKKVNSLNI